MKNSFFVGDDGKPTVLPSLRPSLRPSFREVAKRHEGIE